MYVEDKEDELIGRIQEKAGENEAANLRNLIESVE